MNGLALSVLTALIATTVQASNPEFRVADSLRPRVEFWKTIYAEVSVGEGLLHDTRYPELIYGQVSVRDSKKERERIRSLLLSLHTKTLLQEDFTDEEQRVAELFSEVQETHKYLKAAHRKRLRFQAGQKERFKEGIERSGEYLPHLEALFASRGLPIELTRLPFVESSFNYRVRSQVGASGLWQFMRSTAKEFIRVPDASDDEGLDERSDPMRSSEAAAALLSTNYKTLGSWPLAVTAYNHGRVSMMRATRLLGTTDFTVIQAEHPARSFGFSSANFFVSLLAAIEVEREAANYFPDLKRATRVEFREVKLDRSRRFQALLKEHGVSPQALRELNPSLTGAMIQNKVLIPRGATLRLPPPTIEAKKPGSEQGSEPG
jgi:membrane-bound lytic murein transglycosylase D